MPHPLDYGRREKKPWGMKEIVVVIFGLLALAIGLVVLIVNMCSVGGL